LSDAVDGILKGPNASLKLYDSIISNCSEDGIDVESGGNWVRGFALINNLITDNETGINLYGNQMVDNDAQIINNTIVENVNGIHLQQANNGFMVDVNSNIIANNYEYAIKSGEGYVEYTRLRYNNFYNNGSGDLEFDYSIFNGLGDFGFESDEATNLNGDPSDVGMNIYSNPNFVDEIDYRLAEDSPCINAGDFLLPYDDDGTIADIGAYPYGSENGGGGTDECAYEDLNEDGYDDISFESGLSIGALSGDANGDGVLNVIDLVFFVNAILEQ
jgi:hypothetical protein